MQDRNFDDLAERLKTRVYGSPKGRLRVDLVVEDLLTGIPAIKGSEPLTVLDAGGGMGQISMELARRGHRIVLCDISKNMIREAEIRFRQEGLKDALTVIHGPFQALAGTMGPVFDLVLSHAVLEWLADPRSAVHALAACLKPRGLLSLMFYNVNAMIYQNAIKGNLKKIKAGSFAGESCSLTPQQPLVPGDVLGWFNEAGLDLARATGIRVFYDAMHPLVRKERSYEDIFELERAYCRQEPFVWMGKYIHLMGYLNTGGTMHDCVIDEKH